MRHNKLITGTLLATMLCASGAAFGQAPAGGGAAHGPGVGVQETIGGALVGQVTAAAFVYDWGRFRLSGLFGLFSASDNATAPGNTQTAVTFGANFYYVLHATQYSDFALGGGLVLADQSFRNAGSRLDLGLDAGAQLRAFLVPNVALHAQLGFGIGLFDNDGGTQVALTGNMVGGLGLTYFFR